MAVAVLGAAVASARLNERPDRWLGAACAGGTILRTEALILEDPAPRPAAGSLSAFARTSGVGTCRASVRRMLTDSGWISVTGLIDVRVPPSKLSSTAGPTGYPLAAGQFVRLVGVFHLPEAPLNPGERDQRLWLLQQNVAGSLDVDDDALVTPVPSEGWTDTFFAWRLRLVQTIRSRAAASLDPGPQRDPRPRALTMSLLLGLDEPGENDVRESFTRLGLAHVLAISGFHITLLAMTALLLLRLTGDHGRLEPAAVAALVLIYLAITPASAPVVRAGIMTLAILAARAFGRRHDPLAVLSWTGVVLLAWRPLDLFSLGFQLSLGLTFLLLWLGKRFHERLWGITIRGVLSPRRNIATWSILHGFDHFKRAVSASLLCWGIATPWLAASTALVSPLAVVTSLVVMPLVIGLMGAGYIAMLIGAVSPAGASFTAPILRQIAEHTLTITAWFDSLPASSFRIPPVASAWGLAASALVVLWVARNRRRDWVCLGLAVFLAAWLAVDRRAAAAIEQGRELRVDVLAVGTGQCVLIRSSGTSCLWNCGSLSTGVGQRTVPRAVLALGVGRVDTLIVSGADLEHLAGALDTVDTLAIPHVLATPAVFEEIERSPEGPAAYLARGLAARGVPLARLQPGEPFSIGAAGLTAIQPARSTLTSLLPPAVARLTSPNGACVLLAPDITEEGVRSIADVDLRAGVVLAPARGGLSTLIEASAPGSVAISAPDRPTPDDGRQWLVTGRDGAISITAEGSTLRAGGFAR